MNTHLSSNEISQPQLNVADIVVRDPQRDRRRPKRRLPYLCLRNGRLTLIVEEGTTLDSATPFQ